MKPSARLYSCTLCHKQVVICSDCDRGQIYCGKDCSLSARQTSVRSAGRRYQASFKGKLQHAQRQQRYRQAKKVTHLGSLVTGEHVLLLEVVNKTVRPVILSDRKVLRCHFCKKRVPNLLRSGFLRNDISAKTPTLLNYAQPP